MTDGKHAIWAVSRGLSGCYAAPPILFSDGDDEGDDDENVGSDPS